MKLILTLATLILVGGHSIRAAGTLLFQTSDTGTGPFVFDVGGITRLDNTFKGQIYAGVDANNLAAVGPVGTFGVFNASVNPAANGMIFNGTEVAVASVADSATGSYQIRVWEGAFVSYEAALSVGRKVGASDVVSVQFGAQGSPASPASPAPHVSGFQSFALSRNFTFDFPELPFKTSTAPPFLLPEYPLAGGNPVTNTAPVQYASSKPSVASVSGNMVTLHRPGETVISIVNYIAAPPSTRVLKVFTGYPLGISDQPVSITSVVGSNAVFSVTVTNLGALNYQWQKEGQDIPGATNDSLSLSNLATNDAGIYSVNVTVPNFATNTVTSGGASLSVERLSQSISFGSIGPVWSTASPITLTANASSGLSVQYSSSDPAVASVTGATLTAHAPGAVTITASQSGNETYLPATSLPQILLVYSPVQIQQQPVSTSGFVFSNTVFSVAASGSGPLSYQWRKGGTELTGRTNATLALSNLTTNMAGLYSVVISNPAGSVTSSNALLTVERLPQAITFAPLGPRLTTSSPINLQATAASGLPVTFSSDNHGVASVTGNLLTITGAGSANIVAGQAGDAKWLPAANVPQVQQVYTPVSILQHPVATVATVSSDAVLSVAATSTGPLSYQWRRNGADIGDATNATLTLSKPTTNQAGLYSVRVSNPADEAFSLEALLTVNRLEQTITFGSLQPKLSTDPQFSPGGAASSGLPLSYSSADPSVASVSGQSLIINGPGTTVITVRQNGDSTWMPAPDVSADLFIYTPVDILTHPASVVADVSSNITFFVVAQSSGPLGYQWRRDGGQISGATNATFGIPNVATNDADVYSVVVFNPAGSVKVSSNAVLTVNRLSQTISFGTLPSRRTTDTPFTLMATASSALPVVYQSSNPEVASVGGGVVTLQGPGSTIITAAQPGDGKWLAATNISRTLTVSAPVTVLQQPASTNVVLGSNVLLSVEAVGSPPLTYQWFGRPAGNRRATAAIEAVSGFVFAAQVIDGGSGYGSAPNVRILDATGQGSAATGFATVANGAVTEVTIQTAGFGYVNPQIEIDPPDTRLVGETNPMLTLASVGKSNVGEYFVVVSNVAGSVTSSVASLGLLFPPEIAGQPQSTIVVEGVDAVFGVSVTGTAPMTFTWQRTPVMSEAARVVPDVRNGFVVAAGVVFGGGYYGSPPPVTITGPGTGATAQATISNGQVTDMVIVSAGSGYGSGTQIIVAPPSPGQPMELISSLGNTNLTIPAATLLDSGTYQVSVSNAYGVVTSQSAILRVLSPISSDVPQMTPDGSFHLKVSRLNGFGLADQDRSAIRVHWTSDLKTWQELTSLKILSEGKIEITDTNASALARRFYRIRQE